MGAQVGFVEVWFGHHGLPQGSCSAQWEASRSGTQLRGRPCSPSGSLCVPHAALPRLDLHGPQGLCKHNTIKAQRRLEDSLSNSKGDVARRGTWGASQGLRDVAGPGREESGGGTVEDLHTEDFWVGGTPLSLPFVKRTTAAQRKNGVGEGSRRGHPPAPGVFPHRLWLLPSLF